MPPITIPEGAGDARRGTTITAHPPARPRSRVGGFRALLMLGVFSPGMAVAASDEAAHGTALHETIVVAPRAPVPVPREDGAASASLVTADRTPRSAETASELVAELPGVTVTNLGGLGAFSTVSLRGSTAEQVGVYLDGIPLNAAVGGAVDLALLPIADMDRLEVYRGMSPIGFGASALGGVVSLTSQTPGADRAAAELGGGSFGTTFAGLHASGTRGPVGALVGVQRLASDNDFSFRHDNATFDPTDDRQESRRNNAVAQTDGQARLLFHLSTRRTLTASLWLLERSQGLPGSAVYPALQARLDTGRLITALRYQSPSDLGPGGKLSLQGYVVATRLQLADAANELRRGQQDTDDRTWQTGFTVNARKVIAEWLRLATVADVRLESFAPENRLRGAAVAQPSERLFGAVGLEALAMWRTLALDVQPSLRVEAAHERITTGNFLASPAAPKDQDHLLPMLRLSAVQRPAPWLALKGNLGRYARLPSMHERFGNSGFFLGNADLRPEVGVNADVGAVVSKEGRGVAGRAELAAFTTWVDDLIQLRQGGYYVRPENIGRARVLGLEASASAAVGRFLRGTAQLTFTDARDRSDIAANRGQQLPLRPRLRAYARPELRALPLGRDLCGGVYFDVDHTGGNHVDNAGIVAVPARTLLGAGLHIEHARTGLRLLLSARNLGDQRVFDFIGYPLPGRSFFLTLQWSSDHTEGAT